jgi:hypothetical protein
MVTVLFFAVWGQAFGPAHLGKIQGAAQLLTVVASAAGPWLLAEAKKQTGSYVLFYQCAAIVALALAVVAWFTVLPRFRREAELPDEPLQRAPIFRSASEHVQTAASDQIQRDAI